MLKTSEDIIGGHLPQYHKQMASIVSQIVVVRVNRMLNDGLGGVTTYKSQ